MPFCRKNQVACRQQVRLWLIINGNDEFGQQMIVFHNHPGTMIEAFKLTTMFTMIYTMATMGFFECIVIS